MTMSSNKQKRQILKQQRALKKKKKERAQVRAGVRNGNILPVDSSKILSGGWSVTVPEFYQDYAFQCKDCGSHEVWTAGQQKWWYEEAGGNLESRAVRCRSCRIKERERKIEARKVHLEGITRKNLTN